LSKLVSLIDEEKEKMPLIIFNHNTEKIFEFLNKSKIEKKIF